MLVLSIQSFYVVTLILPIICHCMSSPESAFPAIDYHSQTPWGTHQASIEHRDIDYEYLRTHQINLYDAAVGVVVRRIMDSSMQRDQGDFDTLNKILDGMVISIPDVNEMNAGNLLIWLRNIKCHNLSVQNIIINHKSAVSKKNVRVRVSIQGLSMICDLNWRYEYSIFSGRGSASFNTTRSDAGVTLKFQSTDIDLHPPSSIKASNCNTAIEIDTLSMKGGIVASIANLFSERLKNTVQNVTNTFACDEVNSLTEEMLGEALKYASNIVENYLDDALPLEEHYLNSENNLSVPNGMNLLDFSRLGKANNDWFQTFLQVGDQYLGRRLPDPHSSSGLDYNVNKLLRDFILDSERSLDIPLSLVVFDGHDLLVETIIELNNIKLFGLDTINRVDLLDSKGNFTFSNHFGWDNIDAELDFKITMKPSNQHNSLIDLQVQDEVHETMTVTAGISDIDVDFHFLLAVDKDMIGGLKLGSITNASIILPCIVDSLYQVEVSGLTVDAHRINTPTLSGFLSPGIDRVVSDCADAVFNMYKASLTQALPNIFQLSFRKLVNDIVSKKFSDINVDCPMKQFPSNSTYLNLGDLLLSEEKAVKVGGSGSSPYGHVVRDVVTLVENEVLKIDPHDGRSYLNDVLLSKVTATHSGIPGSLLLYNESGANMRFGAGELEFKLSNITISNIDSVGAPLQLMKPFAPQSLNNTLSFGVGQELKGSVILTIGYDDVDIQIQNVIEVRSSMGGIINAATHMSIIENAFMNFPIEDMLNLNCWLSLMLPPKLDAQGVRLPTSDPSLALEGLSLALTALRLNVTCISCTSPMFEELASLLSSPDAMTELEGVMIQTVNYITNLLDSSFLHVQVDRILAKAPMLCPHNRAYVENPNFAKSNYEGFEYRKQPRESISFLFYIGAIVATCVILAFSIFGIVKSINRKRQDRWLGSLSEFDLAFLEEKQKRKDEEQCQLNTKTTAMVLSPSIPLFIRISIPLIIIGNIALFLSGHLSLGASVDLVVKIAGEEQFIIKGIFSFSMARSLEDIWTAGAKELAILLLVFSGLWPYTKQLTLLALWSMPPSLVSVRRRESIFLWLDFLGKWSFVDVFLLILSLTSLHLAVITPDNLSYLPNDFIDMNLLVMPCWGLYSNMTAQLISQINSHLIIHYHRKVKFDFQEIENCHEKQKELQVDAICRHSFGASNLNKEKIYTLRPLANVILIFLSISFVTLVICGCILPSYSLEQFGLLGVVSSKPLVEHDIFSTVKLLMDQASLTGLISDRIGLTVLSAVLIVTVMIVPFLQLALTLVRWFIPLSQKARLRIFVAVEALSAWQYIEVYLIALIGVRWKLGNISDSMINKFYCGSLEETFATLQYYGILGTSQAQCFRVSAKLEEGFFMLMVAAIIFEVHTHITNTAAAQQEEDLKDRLIYANSSGRNDNVIENHFNGEERTRPHDGKNSTDKLSLEPAKFTDYYRYFVQLN